jgi:pyruvyltransferase
MRRLYPQYSDSIRSVDAPFFETVGEILRSNLVVSSSLHGLIVAEALGVPAVWHRSLMGVDELKFTDYYLGTGRYRIVKADTLQAALKVSPMPLPTFDAVAMLATFPSFTDLEAHGVIVRRGPAEVERSL